MIQNITFGSDSDKDKVYPGVVRYSIEHPEESIIVHFGSADNTPEKVDHIFNFLVSEKTDVFMSGAGMSNVLTGVMKAKAEFDDLIIGIPISDSTTGGLSSLLSTSEKPPLNPVLTVGINNTYAALNISKRYHSLDGGNVLVLSNAGRINYEVDEKSIDKVAEQLDNFRIGYRVAGINSVRKDNIVITVFKHYNETMPVSKLESNILRRVDKRLGKGNGIQVGVREKDMVKRFDCYMECLDGIYSTGIVNIGGYSNAAQVAGILQGNVKSLNIINRKKKEKREYLENVASDIIRDGVRNRYGVFKNGEMVRY